MKIPAKNPAIKAGQKMPLRPTGAYTTLLLIGLVYLNRAALGATPATPAATPVSGRHSASASTRNEDGSGQKLPVKICVIQDRSPSTGWTRTPTITGPQLSELEALVVSRGGELAFATVPDESNGGFERFFVSRPAGDPTPGLGAANIFMAAAQASANASALRAWTETVEQDRQRFHTAAMARLRITPKTKSTNIAGALIRARLYLAESAGPSRRLLVFVSDGVHTGSRPWTNVQLPPGTKFIQVCGSGSKGDLTSFDPTVFEALDPAIRFLQLELLGGVR